MDQRLTERSLVTIRGSLTVADKTLLCLAQPTTADLFHVLLADQLPPSPSDMFQEQAGER